MLSFWHHSQNTSSRDGRLQHKRAARCLVSLNAKKPRHSTVFQGRHLFCMPFMVPLTGIEPVRCCHHGILSPGRLPVPPQRHITNIIIRILQNQEGKAKILPAAAKPANFSLWKQQKLLVREAFYLGCAGQNPEKNSIQTLPEITGGGDLLYC